MIIEHLHPQMHKLLDDCTKFCYTCSAKGEDAKSLVDDIYKIPEHQFNKVRTFFPDHYNEFLARY